MATHTWDHERSKKRIDQQIEALKEVEIVEYTKTMSLESIPANKAYRMDSVHLYADILNLDEILGTTDTEGTRCHQRALRFLNLHYRAVHRILSKCDAIRVDFHNQRLHSVVAKPYNSESEAEAKRIRRAVAIGQLIIDVLKETGDADEDIPSAKVSVGIDSGKSLAVNNGRRGGREPLFLGVPANHAAKHAVCTTPGIYLTNEARKVIGLKTVTDSVKTALTTVEVEACQQAAKLDVTKDQIVKEWKKDLEETPISEFEFSGHTPPMKSLDIEKLTPSNSKRQELLSIYADIDGFTKYVGDNIEGNPKDVVRTLHVIRSELDAALSSDFEGRRIRFVGDCIHGVICEGTAQTTDTEKSISEATRCVGALRSSFDLSVKRLQANAIVTGSLGLAIGFEYGPTAISRLGMQGDRVRCCVSRGVLRSEEEQKDCSGVTTAIGPVAYKKASEKVKNVFGDDRKVDYLNYREATEQLAEQGDESAADAKTAAFASSAPAVAKSADVHIRPFCD